MMKKRNKTSGSKIANNIKNKTNNVRRRVNNSKTIKKVKGQSMSKKKKMILNALLVCIIAFVSIMLIFFAYVIIKAPKFDPNNLKFTKMSEVYDSEGNLIAKMGNENRTEITYDDLPEVLIDAIIATEDSKFFQHNGFDLARFTKASLGQIVGKNAGGASTLTMQIVKNNYTSTVSSGFEGITRKFTDIYLSVFKVERKYTKKEIIEFYVNDSYLGNGAYGVEQASLNYFGKSVGELNLAEASFIAGLFQSPNYYNPYNYPERAEKRRQTVLYLMQRHGYITKEEKEIAQSVPITLLIKTVQTDSRYSEYQGYIDTVVEELENEYDLNPYTTPLKIYTAMNKSKQDFINKVMNGEAWKWENENAQSGIVMTESATGEVIAVGAGRNKNTERSFNYATQTNKQIGSTAKPIFDYGPAVEYLGWGTVNYIDDTPTTYSNGTKISNSDGGYKGRLPLYQALGLSRNITALKTFQQVSKEAGNDKILKFVTNLGITPEIENGRIHEAHSIGSFTGSTKKGESRNSPMTMAGAYGAFSNGGYYIKPHTIKKFVYKETDEVVEPNTNKTRVMYDSTAYIINYSLNWSATEGLARSAANIGGVATAAKTGTSNFDEATRKRYKLSSKAVNDLWVCGYTPKYTLTMWYGYDDITKGYSTTASWSTRDKFYRNLAENLFDKDGSTFEIPSSIEEISVVSGSIPLKKANYGGVVGYFRKGTGPTEVGDEIEENLPSVSGVSSKVSGNTVTLSWNGISADKLLEYNFDETYGTVGYDIYIKDGEAGSETYVGTTTSNSYSHTTSYSNPIYVIYTAFSNYKNNRSSGVSHKVAITSDFEVIAHSCEIDSLSEINSCKQYVIVMYNGADVTEGANINVANYTNNNIKYEVSYQGKTKTVSGKLNIKTPTTTTSTSESVQ